jgi:arginyl-tRNA synthetase
MVLARELKNFAATPREDISKDRARDIAESPTVAGAGFINFRLTDSFLAREAAAIAKDERLGRHRPLHGTDHHRFQFAVTPN